MVSSGAMDYSGLGWGKLQVTKACQNHRWKPVSTTWGNKERGKAEDGKIL